MNAPRPAPPIERIFDLFDLSDAGYETTISARDAELARIAEWEGVDEVTRFQGSVRLRRLSRSRYSYEAALEADIAQTCVVTLEPVRAQIARSFARVLHVLPGLHHHGDSGGALTLAAADDESPEEIDSSHFDLAAPLLEEFALAVDPYPRAPGVAFQAPDDHNAKRQTPFAVLKRLKLPR